MGWSYANSRLHVRRSLARAGIGLLVAGLLGVCALPAFAVSVPGSTWSGEVSAPWSGYWNRDPSEIGRHDPFSFTLQQAGSSVTGSYSWQGCASSRGGNFTGTADGDQAQLSFTATDGSDGTIDATLSANGQSISGTATFSGSCSRTVGFDATRVDGLGTGITLPATCGAPIAAAGGAGVSSQSCTTITRDSMTIDPACALSYLEPTLSCDDSYYVWHCGSSYYQRFTECPPDTPGALPPVTPLVEAHAAATHSDAVQVAGGTASIGASQYVGLALAFTAQAKRSLASLKLKLAALTREAQRDKRAGHASAARRLQREVDQHRTVDFLLQVKGETTGAYETYKVPLTVSVPK